MVKSLQDYLGQNAVANGGIVTINLDDLLQTLSISPFFRPNDNDAVGIISLLVMALHKAAAPELSEIGIPIEDAEQGIVGDIRTSRKRIVDRAGNSQVRHTRTFQIYTFDKSDYSPADTIGTDRESEPFDPFSRPPIEL